MRPKTSRVRSVLGRGLWKGQGPPAEPPGSPGPGAAVPGVKGGGLHPGGSSWGEASEDMTGNLGRGAHPPRASCDSQHLPGEGTCGGSCRSHDGYSVNIHAAPCPGDPSPLHPRHDLQEQSLLVQPPDQGPVSILSATGGSPSPLYLIQTPCHPRWGVPVTEQPLYPDLEASFCCSVTQSCPTLCDPMDCSIPGLPVHHQLPEFAQTHVHQVGDAIRSSHPLSSPSPPAFNLSQHQGLFR